MNQAVKDYLEAKLRREQALAQVVSEAMFKVFERVAKEQGEQPTKLP